MRDAGTLRVPSALLGAMLADGWGKWPMESGGILLGHSGPRWHVMSHIIGAGPQAVHEPFKLIPDSPWQAAQVAAAWRQDPTVAYLGDWHTHPGGTTRFSELDRAAAESIADYADARQREPIILVLALGRDLSSQVAAAQLKQRRVRRLAVAVLDSREVARKAEVA